MSTVPTIEFHRPTIEGALRTLDVHGFATQELWRELASRIATYERGTPGEADMRYTCPTVAPDIATHFTEGGVPQELSASVMWAGYSYSLTPGQRAVLRDTYGLTPTQTVTVDFIEMWPGTQHPRSVKLRSDVHVDPRNRRHVLTQCVIRDVATFFADAQEHDNAQGGGASKRQLVDEFLTVDKVYDLTSTDAWAVEDITGVKVSRRVEMRSVSADRFTLVCTDSGNIAKVPRKEFFATVAEYDRLYATPKAKRVTKRVAKEQQSLESMLASLLK